MSLSVHEVALPPLDTALSTERTRVRGDEMLKAATFLCHTDGADFKLFNHFLTEFGDKVPVGELSIYSRVASLIAQCPTTPAEGIQAITGVDRAKLLWIQDWVQGSKLFRTVLTSAYYPEYLMVRYAQSFFKDLVKNPKYLADVVDGKPVAPKRLEIHATNANCNYRCEMCLWDAQGKGKYVYEPEKKVLSVKNWNGVLDQAKEMGTEVIIFSGGGEPLLRSNAGEIIDHANEIGLSTMIYTNGSKLEAIPKESRLYKAMLNSNWLRVSLHTATDERYAEHVGLPMESRPLSKVIRGIQRLKRDRDSLGLPLKIGLGFVAQHRNFDQVREVAELAKELGMNMLNIREDCIDITQSLSLEEKELLNQQLRDIREGLDSGYYEGMDIDFADSLIGKMNNWKKYPHVETSEDCKVHLYRSAIDPFGRVAVCDLVSEPFFATNSLTLGYISKDRYYKSVLEEAAGKQFDATSCAHCMPGQKAINALWFKVLKDYEYGLKPENQPFLFRKAQFHH